MKFKVGDVCEIVRTLWNHQFRGSECTIVAVGLVTYECITYSERHTRFAFPFQLRLKRPPNKDKLTAGKWELCPFNPYKAKERVT